MTIHLSLVAMSLLGHVIHSQVTFDRHCEGNYTEKDMVGNIVYRVQATSVYQCKYHNGSSHQENFNVTLLGNESDRRRNLSIAWDTLVRSSLVRSSILSISFTYSTEDHPRIKCFHFEIQKPKLTAQERQLKFDCVTISNGIKGLLRICEDSIPSCAEKKIDTITCTCPATTLSVSGRLLRDEQDVIFTVGYTGASHSEKLDFTIEKDGLFVGRPDDIFPIYANGSLEFRVIHESFGNYTVKTTVYCLDYNDARQDQVCKTEGFNVTITNPAKPTTQKRTPIPLHVYAYIVTGSLILLIATAAVILYRKWFIVRETPSSSSNNRVPLTHYETETFTSSLNNREPLTHYETETFTSSLNNRVPLTHYETDSCSKLQKWA